MLLPLLFPLLLVSASASDGGDLMRSSLPAEASQQTIPAEMIRWNQAGPAPLPAATKPVVSRRRRVLIGALVGFSAGFGTGMATAGYVGDTNNPRLGMRAENGARFGGFGAGVGALIGLLTGKK
jgi:hypothetical protein